MSLSRYYKELGKTGQDAFLERVGTTRRYFEYFVLGIKNKSGNRRFPRENLLDAIYTACEGKVSYLEILCDLLPKAKRDLDLLLRMGWATRVAGARPRPIETNASLPVNGDQSNTDDVETDQSIYGG